MPSINKGQKRPKNALYKAKKNETNKVIASIYATPQWRKLRLYYIQSHPLCEDCLDENIRNEDGNFGSVITPATEVHHIVPISTASSELEMKEIAFDPKNLRSLCDYHHHLTHTIMHRTKKNEKKF